MTRQDNSRDPKPANSNSEQQPEALAAFDEAAKSRTGEKPDTRGVEANAKTAPQHADPEAKNRDATKILNAGATGNKAQKDEAIADRRDKDKRAP